MEGRARDAKVIAVATEGDPQIERFADDVLLGPRHPRGAAARSSRSSRSSCSPTTWRSPAARTSTSRATWRSRSRSSRRRGRELDPTTSRSQPGSSRRARPSSASTSSRSTGSGPRSRSSASRFSRRVLTPTEQRYVRDRPETFAGRWAAKEAVSKVLGLGVRGIGWRTSRSSGCRPASRPSACTAARRPRAEQLGMGRIAVSITPRIRLRGRDRVRRPDGRRPLRLPARHRGAARRPRAADPRPDGAAPCRGRDGGAAATAPTDAAEEA